MKFPVNRLAEPRTIRLVASARLRDPVLWKLVDDKNQMNELAEIESATSGRLYTQKRGTDNIDPREFVAGIPHSHFINAAFAYWLPKDLNRFNHPGRGAWYSALTTETALKESIFHMNRELSRINDYNATIDYAEMFASFAGEFVDLREVTPTPNCLNPNPDIGYPEGNIVADYTRTSGYNGIIYPSARDNTGTCLVALQPQAVQSVAQGDVLRVSWQGSASYVVQRIPR
jgi:RES domain-containing protein